MGFVTKLEDVIAQGQGTGDFYGAQRLNVFWETKPETVARLLPHPLEPVTRPLVTAFVACYPTTNFGVSYYESALALRASFKGQEGYYWLAMPVTNDLAMAIGREKYGFPKKMAEEIRLERAGDQGEGWTQRRGVHFMHLKAKLTGKMNAGAVVPQYLLQAAETKVLNALSYNFKSFPAPGAGGFDYNPRLVKQVTVQKLKEIVFGEAELSVVHSDYDSWDEIEVVKLIGASYMVFDASMLPGEVIAEVEPAAYAPFIGPRWDWK